MGCDIHIFAESKNKETNKWGKVGDAFTLDSYDKEKMKKDKGCHPFDWQSYSLFAFLANVRNYSRCEAISEPRGIPNDVSDSVYDEYFECWGLAHSASFLTLRELSEFDYEKTFWNRRISRTTVMPNGIESTNCAALAEEGEGTVMSYRENLGERFFVHLEELKALGEPDDVRIVFWFDN